MASIKYSKGMIEVATRQGKVPISAMVAKGTGLAYHGYLYMDNTVLDTPLEVTHIGTGLAIKQVNKPMQARKVISQLVELDNVNWTLENPLDCMKVEQYDAVKQAIKDIEV